MFLVIACSTTIRQGTIINDDYKNIKEGITHKINVEEMLGQPSFKVDDNTWIYYSYYISKYGIKKSNIQNEKILIIKFDEDGITESTQYEERVKQGLNLDKKELEYKNIEKQNFFKELFKEPVIVPKQ